jgi:hypothetical protein
MSVNKFIWHFALSVYSCGLLHFVLEKDARKHRIVPFDTRVDSNMPPRLADCFYRFSLWVSMPLAIWLSCGWIALIAHWQLIRGSSRLLEETQPALTGFATRPLQ